MIISMYLEENQKEHLLSMLCVHKGALGHNIVNINDMDPLICTDNITL